MSKKNKQRAKAITQAQKQRREEKPVAPQVVRTDAPVIVAKPSLPEPESKPQAIAPVLFTIDQLCTYLSISRTALYRMAKAGKVPGRLDLGGQVRYHREVIDNWLLERMEECK